MLGLLRSKDRDDTFIYKQNEVLKYKIKNVITNNKFGMSACHPCNYSYFAIDYKRTIKCVYLQKVGACLDKKKHAQKVILSKGNLAQIDGFTLEGIKNNKVAVFCKEGVIERICCGFY